MTKQDFIKAIDNRLRKLDIPSKEIKVYGSINARIVITCKSLSTAKQWSMTLNKFCSKVQTVESIDYLKVNKNTVLRPSTERVFKVHGVI